MSTKCGQVPRRTGLVTSEPRRGAESSETICRRAGLRAEEVDRSTLASGSHTNRTVLMSTVNFANMFMHMHTRMNGCRTRKKWVDSVFCIRDIVTIFFKKISSGNTIYFNCSTFNS